MTSTSFPDNYTSPESSLFVQPETDPELVHPDAKFFCPVHGGLLRAPIQTPCGHRLCRACLAVLLDGEESKLCPVEDEEREEVSAQNVYPDTGITRDIKNQKVYCYYKGKGCRKTMKYKDLSAHVAECPYRPVPCMYRLRGCLQPVLEIVKSQHEASCGFKPVSCHSCVQEINFADVETHLSNTCPETVVSCPYDCGEEKKRREMIEHSSVCTLKPKECEYSVLGCPFMGNESEIAQHVKRFDNHFETLVTFVCGLKMELTHFFSTSDIKFLIGLKEKITLLETTIQEMAQDFRKKDTVRLGKLVELEKTLEEARRDQEVAVEEIRQLKENLKNLQDELSGHSTSRGLPLLKSMELSLAESEIRFQMIETASYDGTLLWKIQDFTIRRRDAAQGRTVSLYSQPFYSDRHGYKMCGRVYLNGDGIGKGTHISIYFVVMKGQYDALLDWPFQQQISMTVLDQSPRKNHVTESFLPDPASNSFQRPIRTDMNVASGCPLFIAQSTVDNPSNYYVKDDTLFIRISITPHT